MSFFTEGLNHSHYIFGFGLSGFIGFVGLGGSNVTSMHICESFWEEESQSSSSGSSLR